MKTRYEIEVARMKDGRLRMHIWDEYWDSSETAVLDTGFGKPVLEANARVHRIFDGVAEQLPALRSGWYALRMPKTEYPFGTPTELERIPGRHLVYRKA